MSSPILPSGGPQGVSAVPQPDTPQDAVPAAPVASVTITEGLQIQGASIDKAAQNAPQCTNLAGDEPAPVQGADDSTVLGPADLAALQLKSAAQWQSDATPPTTTTPPPVTTTPPVKDIAVNKSQVVTGVSSDTAVDEMSAVSTDTTTAPSPADTLSLFQDWPFQQMFGQAFGMDSFLGSMGWELPSWLQPNDSYGQQDPDPHAYNRSTTSVHKWMEQMVIGGQVTTVIAEEFMTTIEQVASSKVTAVSCHTFTLDDVNKAIGGLQDQGLLPKDIPDRDTICQNIAKAAQDTIDKLNQRFGAAGAGLAAQP